MAEYYEPFSQDYVTLPSFQFLGNVIKKKNPNFYSVHAGSFTFSLFRSPKLLYLNVQPYQRPPLHMTVPGFIARAESLN